MCLVSVTEHHAFKVHPGCRVGQHQPFRGQAPAACHPPACEHGLGPGVGRQGSAGAGFPSHRPWF